jgi:AraC family L-rhamnose operon regulatory protein RhaS
MPSLSLPPPWIIQYGSGHTRHLEVHRNPGLEVVYVEGGNLPWQVDGKPEPVGPGSVFFTLPWQWHGSMAEFEPGHHWYFAVFRVEGKGIEHPGPLQFPEALGFTFSEQRQLFASLRAAPRHSWPASPKLAQAMAALVEECNTGGPFQTRRCASWSAIVLLELEQAIRNNCALKALPGTLPIRHLIQELEARIDEPWTLEAMASFCGLKRTQFAQRLRLHTGDTPMGLLNRLRVEHARRMLRESSQTITEIAMACGFDSSQYFARIFRSFTGMRASEYRDTLAAGDSGRASAAAPSRFRCAK